MVRAAADGQQFVSARQWSSSLAARSIRRAGGLNDGRDLLFIERSDQQLAQRFGAPFI